MAYEKNPMRSERICSLGRELGSITTPFVETYTTQWFERTLNDSAVSGLVDNVSVIGRPRVQLLGGHKTKIADMRRPPVPPAIQKKKHVLTETDPPN